MRQPVMFIPSICDPNRPTILVASTTTKQHPMVCVCVLCFEWLHHWRKIDVESKLSLFQNNWHDIMFYYYYYYNTTSAGVFPMNSVWVIVVNRNKRYQSISFSPFPFSISLSLFFIDYKYIFPLNSLSSYIIYIYESHPYGFIELASTIFRWQTQFCVVAAIIITTLTTLKDSILFISFHWN